MLNKEKEVQKILRGKFMQGPKLLMDDESTGINYFSGNTKSAYYELYGATSIFRLIILEPSDNLYTSYFVGKNHLMFLLMEEEQVRGGFVSLTQDLMTEFRKAFSHLREEQLGELYMLWLKFGSGHYNSLLKE